MQHEGEKLLRAGLRLRSFVALTGLGGLLLAGSAAPALGVDRYASPAGTGSMPCIASNPCPIGVAVTGAAQDDSVRLSEGDYTLTETLNVVTRIGADLGAQARLKYVGPATTPAIRIDGDLSSVANISVEGATHQTVALVDAPSRAIGQVVTAEVHQHGTGPAMDLRGAVSLHDSLVVARGDSAAVHGRDIHGSTIVNLGPGPALEATYGAVRNSILKGGPSAPFDVVGPTNPLSRLEIDYSALRPDGVSPGSTSLGPHNIYLPPALGGGTDIFDPRQVPTSPTIDAGTADLYSPAFVATVFDVDGDPRRWGAARDIGADEYAPITVLHPFLREVTPSSAAIQGVVYPISRHETPHIEYGRTELLGSVSRARGNEPDMILLSGLQAETRYYARMVFTAAGRRPLQGVSPMIIFTTPSLRPSKPLFILTMRLRQRRVTVGQSPVLVFRLKEAATLKVTIDRHFQGRMRGTRCIAGATKGKRCTKTSRIGSVKRTLPANPGSTLFQIPARIHGRLLEAGWYRLTLTGNSKSDGRAMKPQRVSLIVRPSSSRR